MSGSELHVLVPGGAGPEHSSRGMASHDMVEALRARGWTVQVHALPGPYPRIDASAILAADIAMARLPDRALVLVDGHTLPGVAAAMGLDKHRLRLVVLADRPLSREAGLDPDEATALRNLEQGALSCARRVLVPGEETAEALAELGIAGERVAIVPPGDGAVDRLAAELARV